MTEACNSIGPLELIRSYPHSVWSARRARLFCVNCARRVSSLLSDPKCDAALEIAVRYADGLADDLELDGAIRSVADRVEHEARIDMTSVSSRAAEAVLSAAMCPPEEYTAIDALEAIAERFAGPDPEVRSTSRKVIEAGRAERARLAQLVREIAGNPFRPVALDPSWLTFTVAALARGIYDDRAFDRLPILADALMDAGCDNADLLNHCREDGPHARGCWVVDLLLGKA